jgi:HK97 family phage portal protein
MSNFEQALKHCQESHQLYLKRTQSETKLAKEKRYSLSDLDKDMDLLITGRQTATGVNVTANTAMNCVPYFAGVRLIAETVGQLPLKEYRRLQPRGKEPATDQVLYRLLHDEPNPEMDAISFKESLQGHAVPWGNAFAEIQWDMEAGIPVALWPLNVSKMKVGRDTQTKKLIYAYTLPDGMTVILPAYRVWHMPGFGFDGIIGYDTIYLAREAIGMALALEEFGARFFGNGSNPGGVLEHPNRLTPAAQENLRKSWNEMHTGLSNQHRIAILEEGMKYHQVGIPPENAQFLESRKFQLNEIARLLHIPPHMLADLDRATFSNIEHQGIEFVTYTMMPWFVRWEQTCNRKLLLPGERQTYFCEFLTNALLRGDSAARASYMRERFYIGSMSPNDMREYENENPIDDPAADKYYIQANMLPIDMAGQAQNKDVVAAGNRDAAQAMLSDAVRRIAEREKQNILRQAKKNPDGVNEWLPEFYRDFREFIVRQVEPALGDKAGEYAQRYIDQSKRDIEAMPAPNIEVLMTNWETSRPEPSITGLI